MSILIRGMEMPKEGNWKTVRIYPDGTCAVPNWQGDCMLLKGAQAAELPPHGRLIDADALVKDRWKLFRIVIEPEISYNQQKQLNDPDIPTIIEAEEGET